jgi:hypothetical protein
MAFRCGRQLGFSALPPSAVYRHYADESSLLNEAQTWEQLEIVKRNLLSGLRNEDVLVAPPTEVPIDPESQMKRLTRSFISMRHCPNIFSIDAAY